MTTSRSARNPAEFADERAALGNPSFVWRFGQDRRLDLIRACVPLDNQRILDVGCGIGTYVKRLRQFSNDVYGFDVAADRVAKGAREVPNLLVAEGEHLPFRTASFDVVILNEVIEHVRDDRATMAELARILKPGGHAVFFAPNRLYPFETHGVYFGGRYVFGNIPLINYLPGALRRRVVPHARAYLTRDFRRITRGLPFRTVVHTYVYPGFDNIAARSPAAAKLLRQSLYAAEGSWLKIFGLSHLLILQRESGGERLAGSLSAGSPEDGSGVVVAEAGE